MGQRLNNKVAIVTGGGRGIGRGICLAFASEGANVVVDDIDADPAAEVVKEIENLGGKAIAVRANVRHSEEVEEMVRTTLDKFGQIDILVNNAGITRDMAMFKMTPDDWSDVVDTSLKGTFNCSQAVCNWIVPQARKEREEGKTPPCRKIINVTSGAGVRGNPGQANYSAAKAGIMGLTKSNAKEFARHNILVNAICPVALTRMTQDMKEDFAKRIPLGRIGDPQQDIAPVVVFLASEEANYITGQVIPVNGGLDMAI